MTIEIKIWAKNEISNLKIIFEVSGWLPIELFAAITKNKGVAKNNNMPIARKVSIKFSKSKMADKFLIWIYPPFQ